MRRGLAVLVLLASALAAPRPAAASLDEFARCLTRARARYYTAAWCPHCARQNEMFGAAIGWLNVVDCTAGCAGVKSFPTWEFRDGSRVSGVLPLSQLGRRTGCTVDAQRGAVPAPEREARPVSAARGGIPTRERWVGGARIIEVPGR
jgi:hypothetical protein